jgi:hypothetical protein
MKKLISTIALMAAAIAVTQSSALAGGRPGNSSIGPSVTFGNGQSVFGVNGKFGVADNVSIRPYVNFPNGGTNFGASLTYDWKFDPNQYYGGRGYRHRHNQSSFAPFVGIGANVATASGQSNTNAFAQVGTDFNINDTVSVLGAVNIPISSQTNNSTNVTVGANLRF